MRGTTSGQLSKLPQKREEPQECQKCHNVVEFETQLYQNFRENYYYFFAKIQVFNAQKTFLAHEQSGQRDLVENESYK